MAGKGDDYIAKHDLERLSNDLLFTLRQQQPAQPVDAMIDALCDLRMRREQGESIASYQETFRVAMGKTMGGGEGGKEKGQNGEDPGEEFDNFAWNYEPNEEARAKALSEATSTVGWSDKTKTAMATAVSGGPTQYPAGFRTGRRQSISAEPYTPSESSQFHRVVIHKDPATRERIASAVDHNMLFRNLDPEQLSQILDAMFEKRITAGTEVIRQGDEGDYFYVIDEGHFQVIKDGEVVVELGPGESFGELALMYGSPRMATVRALEDGVLWAVDRATFRGIIIDLSFRKRRLYEGFLRSVPLLSTLHDHELHRVCDALQPARFAAGEEIVRQGELGHEFYIIEDGQAVVTMQSAIDDKSHEVEVARIGKGGYFGELALLNDAPRAATVRALTTVKCVTLTKADFIRLLGPVMSILQRNQDHYRKYEEYLKQSSKK